MMLEDPTDSESETIEELYEGDDDDDDAGPEAEIDDDGGDPALTPGDGAEDATEEGDDDSDTDDTGSEDEEDEDDEEPLLDLGLTEEPDPTPVPLLASSERGSSKGSRTPSASPLPASPKVKPISPAQLRRNGLAFVLANAPRTYNVEAICAIPHPVPTHALASSACMTHVLTGSDDGYIRDYDIFTAVNGKTFLSAPQRHHAAVVEGLMKAGQLRCWWENPAPPITQPGILTIEEEPSLSPAYSLVMHPDALWALAGTDRGTINLFTVRHEPGKLCHILNGHRGPVSAMALDYDEKGFFSAGWDGEAIQWDLNTGQKVRTLTAHNSQLTSIAVRPLSSGYVQPGLATDATFASRHSGQTQANSSGMDADPCSKPFGMDTSVQTEEKPESMAVDPDARSDASEFDPLFDDVPEESTKQQAANDSRLAIPGNSQPQGLLPPSTKPPPKGAPPLFDPIEYSTYSSDLLMTAFVDGQVVLWDRRVNTPGKGVGRLWMSDKTPPWCLSACWSADGAHIYAGRRNGTVDCWDVRVLGQSGPANTPRLFKSLRNPTSSGVVSCVVAFPDCRHVACASVDNIRLWNIADGEETGRSKSPVQFKIIPGHHGGYISQMIIDAGSRFLISASSNRGWHGDSTRTVFVHDIKHVY